MAKSQLIHDVAIAGFGPTGAILAGLLGRMGRSVLVVEREPEVYRLPRAVHFDQEIMRIFQSLGLCEAILPITRAIPRCVFWSTDRETLLEMNLDRETTDQGWASDYLFHQPSLERILRDAALEYPSVEVRYGEFVGFEAESDSVEIEIAGNDGTRESARAKFLVGCDGAASAIRRELGFEVEDMQFDEPWVVVDLLGAEGLPPDLVQYCDPARPTTSAPCANGFHRFEFMLLPDEPAEEMGQPERLRPLLSPWVDPDRVEIVRAAVYRFHAVVARDWWRGRVGIAGDAAHQMPPFLGQGMCSGIRDAANLAWKLDLILAGVTGLGLLETYTPERAPQVRSTIATAVDIGQLICIQDPQAAAARDAQLLERSDRRLPPLELPGIDAGVLLAGCSRAGKRGLQARIRSGSGDVGLLDDVLGTGFVVLVRGGDMPKLSEPAAKVLEAVGGTVFPIDSDCDVEGAYTRWFDGNEFDAALIRPDHYIFGTARGLDAASTLLVALADHLELA